MEKDLIMLNKKKTFFVSGESLLNQKSKLEQKT